MSEQPPYVHKKQLKLDNTFDKIHLQKVKKK